jgi:hypothetical protein
MFELIAHLGLARTTIRGLTGIDARCCVSFDVTNQGRPRSGDSNAEEIEKG